MDMLKVFDVASPNECFQRSESIVPQQALALSNSELSLDMARLLAAQRFSPAAAETPSRATALAGNRSIADQTRSPDDDFVVAAFDRILNRAPSPEEVKASVDYLRSQAELYSDPARLTPFGSGSRARVKPSADPAQRARESFVHVLFNHNDFVTVR
jgi:hypothetical protein